VCSPQDALASFLQLGADHLVMGDFIVARHALERCRAALDTGRRRDTKLAQEPS